MNVNFSLEVGYRSEPGLGREFNEDSFILLAPPNTTPDIKILMAVADGMGGHRAGNVASQFVVEALDSVFTSSEYRNYVTYNPNRPDYYMVVLKEVLERINQQLYDLSARYPELKGMGTTATVIVLAKGKIYWGHVGDSRAYLLRRNSLRRLTHDHTWVSKQVEEGLLTPEEAMYHPWRNVLIQSLGGGPLVEVERGIEMVKPGDVILLCSDGLTSVVDDSEIQKVLLTSASSQIACDRLVDLAHKRGSLDDITILVARISSGSVESSIPDGRIIGPAERRPYRQSSPKTVENRLRSQGLMGLVSSLVKIVFILLVILLCGLVMMIVTRLLSALTLLGR